MIKEMFKRKAAPEPEKPKPWPSALNPCPTPDEHKALGEKAPLWGVKGRTTKVCLWCVMEGEKTHGTRQKYLDTLNPDPNGSASQ